MCESEIPLPVASAVICASRRAIFSSYSGRRGSMASTTDTVRDNVDAMIMQTNFLASA
jgi:hypothetical protein